MHIIVSAQFCEFKETGTPGVTMMSTMLFSDQISQETHQVESAAQVIARMQLTFDAVKAAHPGRSFYVSQIRHPHDRSRAFGGYKNMKRRMEYNANAETARTPEAATV